MDFENGQQEQQRESHRMEIKKWLKEGTLTREDLEGLLREDTGKKLESKGEDERLPDRVVIDAWSKCHNAADLKALIQQQTPGVVQVDQINAGRLFVVCREGSQVGTIVPHRFETMTKFIEFYQLSKDADLTKRPRSIVNPAYARRAGPDKWVLDGEKGALV